MTDVDTMSLDDLRIAVAIQMFDWTWHKHPTKDIFYLRPPNGGNYGAIRQGDLIEYTIEYTHYLPDYARDIAEAQQITTAIKERGLMPQFIDALIVQVLGRDMLVRHEMRGLDSEEVAALVLASPEQICRAALRTIRSAR